MSYLFFPFAITMISISIFYQTHSTYLLYTCITSFGALSIQWAFTMTADVLLAEAAPEGQLGTLLHRFPCCAVLPNAHPNSLLIDVLLFFCFQRCKFQVGSYSYDDTKMIFLESPRVKGYVETSRSIVLDYEVVIKPLKESDRILSYGSLGNYSLAGFEMILHRYVSHYIITYYLPSGKSFFLDHYKRLSLTQSSRKLLGIRNGRSCESGAISEIPNFVFST